MMMKRSYLNGLVILLVLFWSCGRKGPVLPPLQKIPKSVEGASLVQVGLEFRLRWQIPTGYVDGSPMESLSAIELWIFEQDIPGKPEGEEGKEDAEQVEKEGVVEDIAEEAPPPEPPFVPAGPERMISEARLLEEISPDRFAEFQTDPEGSPLEFSYVYSVERAQIGASHYGFALKVRDARGRFSDFSPWVTAGPLNVTVPVRGLKAELSRNRATITWREPARHLDGSEPAVVAGYNVYRAVGEAEPTRVNSSLLTEPKFEDRAVQYGSTYRYLIRAVTGESAPFAESADSKPLEVEVKDTFAPSSPKGLIAITGEDFISLSWDRSRESDLASYRVWRRPAGTEEYTLLTPEGIQDNSFTDTGARKNVRYEYSVTAMDQNGNESGRSKRVTATITGESHAHLPI